MDECIIWEGSINVKGYGVRQYEGKTTGAHRVAYIEAKGAIPKGLVIDHLCRNRACVNPNHLEAVTNKENLARGIGTFSAINAAKTHCPQGHEYAGENLYLSPSGARVCRTCKKAQCRATYLRNKASQVDGKR